MTSSLPFEDDRCNNAWWKIRMTHNYFFKSHNPQIFSSRGQRWKRKRNVNGPVFDMTQVVLCSFEYEDPIQCMCIPG